MRNDSMYFTMYNETIHKLGTQQKTIDELKAHIKILTTEMEIYKTKMRKELMRLKIELGKKNENDWVDY
jgi:hypothetical protein